MKCEQCGKQITESDFMDDNGDILCEDCYEELSEPDDCPGDGINI